VSCSVYGPPGPPCAVLSIRTFSGPPGLPRAALCLRTSLCRAAYMDLLETSCTSSCCAGFTLLKSRVFFVSYVVCLCNVFFYFYCCRLSSVGKVMLISSIRHSVHVPCYYYGYFVCLSVSVCLSVTLTFLSLLVLLSRDHQLDTELSRHVNDSASFYEILTA